jgi:hypothetical protein
MIFAGETEVLGENLPSVTLSTTNPTWIDLGANPGLRGERPATNRLSHGTALQACIYRNIIRYARYAAGVILREQKRGEDIREDLKIFKLTDSILIQNSGNNTYKTWMTMVSPRRYIITNHKAQEM